MAISYNIIYLAYRYIRNKHQHASIQTMMYVCGLGICIATFSLGLCIAIMNGFKQATYQKMQSIYPDIIIDMENKDFDDTAINTMLEQEKHIKHFAYEYITQALIINPQHSTSPTMIVLRGINPQQEEQVSNIALKIINPQNSNFQKIVQPNSIIIGSKLAQDLQVTCNDELSILYSTDSYSLNIQFQQICVTVAGIFQTGIDEFDTNLVYCHHDVIEQIFPDLGISHIHIKLDSTQHEQQVCQNLQAQLHASVYSWKDLYPALLSALELEKLAMFLILLLITCIASMNIISLLFMYVTQKQRDIIILTCMGMPLHKIRLIFVTIGLLITLPATFAGLMLAAIMGIILQTFPCIKLPDNVYDTQYLPVQLDATTFIIIAVVTIFISLAASWYATKNINKIKIIDLLKSN